MQLVSETFYIHQIYPCSINMSDMYGSMAPVMKLTHFRKELQYVVHSLPLVTNVAKAPGAVAYLSDVQHLNSSFQAMILLLLNHITHCVGHLSQH